MFSKISILIGLLFASIYLLCFLINAKDPIKSYVHRFHVGLANIIGALAVLGILTTQISVPLKIPALTWLGIFLFLSWRLWQEECLSCSLAVIPSGIGLWVYGLVHQQFIGGSVLSILGSILGGIILCLSAFSMNLGHGYLNIHGLPIRHLKRTVDVFIYFLGLRALWDLFYFGMGKVFYEGERIPLCHFSQTMDGFFLWIALFFGTVFPLVSLFFVKGTLAVKSTQSATGILYVILTAVCIGEITYKYYLIKFGLPL